MGLIMRPTLSALVALLVAAATIATGAPVSPPANTNAATGVADGAETVPQGSVSAPIETSQNTSGYLSLPDHARASAQFGNATLDVAGTVAMDTAQLQTELNETATREAIQSAESSTNKTAIVRRAADSIQNRTVSLRDRQQRIIGAYNRGEISSEALLQQLAIIDAESRQIERFTRDIRQTADLTPGYTLPNSLRTRLKRFGSLRMSSTVLRGPIRGNVGQALSGEQDEFTVYIETTNDGIALSRLSGNLFVRETFLASENEQNSPSEFTQGSEVPISNFSSAIQRARELYSWSFENRLSASLNRYSGTSVYQISIDHTQGQLTSYIDGTTTNVFREIQEKRLSRLPISSTATNTTTNLSIRANLTHESGPMNVSVIDPETDEPADARITVNGQFVGETDADGKLWTIQPYGPVTINATTSAGERVTLELDG